MYVHGRTMIRKSIFGSYINEIHIRRSVLQLISLEVKYAMYVYNEYSFYSLSESNLSTVSGQLEESYMCNSRNGELRIISCYRLPFYKRPM